MHTSVLFTGCPICMHLSCSLVVLYAYICLVHWLSYMDTSVLFTGCPICIHLSCSLVVCCAPGRCYPCVQLVSVSCACGKTHVSVACGRERSIKPPRCRQPCLKSSLCHHSNPHHCHEGNCPPCRKRCGQLLSCGHQCEARCHATPYLIHKVRTPSWLDITISSHIQWVSRESECVG